MVTLTELVKLVDSKVDNEMEKLREISYMMHEHQIECITLVRFQTASENEIL